MPKLKTTTVELVSEDLRACRACLATNCYLYSIPDGLEDKFVQLLGVEYSDDDGLPQHLCACCRMLLLKFRDFRRRCDRAQLLLKQALKRQPYIFTTDIQAIDRTVHKLSLNLVQLGVYTFDSNTEKEDFNEFRLNDDFDNREDFNDVLNKTDDPLYENREPINVKGNDENREYINVINQNAEVVKLDATDERDKKKGLFVEIDGLNGTITVNTMDTTADAEKRRTAKYRKQHKKEQEKKKAEKAKERKERVTKLLRYVAGKKINEKPLTKWQLYQRRADNDFLPNFNHAEFESENDCKIEILTIEQQLEEIEERKRSDNYLNLDYKCDHCGRGFEFEQPYKNHMMKHDPSVGKCICNICGIRFRIQSLKHRHLDSHRMKFTCNICSFVSRAKHTAHNHFLMHMGKVFQCNQCDATFTKNSSYFGHLRISHPSTEFTCEVCGDSFVGRRGLLAHKAKAHRALAKPKLKCRTCGVQFASSDARKRHTGEAKCDPSLKPCGECGEVFSDDALLKKHTEEKHLPVLYWCEECSCSFLSQQSLHTHRQRIHLGVKWPAYGRDREMNREYYRKLIQRRRVKAQVVCEMCGVKVKSNSALERHQQSHCKREITKSYKCPHCAKTCATRQGLQLHVTLHTGEKPYKCPQCPLGFRQAGAMKRHHRAVHLGIDTRVTCEICEKSFSTPTTRKLHVNTVHLGLPQPPRRRRTDTRDQS